jgi:hypothetical protein
VRLSLLVNRIESRGGRVITVRMPTTGRAWVRDAEHLPKAEVYDRFASEVGGEWHHFTEMAGAEDLYAPDGSHLDSPSSANFTSWVATIARPL